MEILEELLTKLKGDVGGWEEEILRCAYDLARSIFSGVKIQRRLYRDGEGMNS